ncbi:MAG TPA: hypothetical protein VK993_03600 [Chthoniobacterales bacterium]|nr:hypothetical protein [Chthoniobacterales bacterium]
MLFTAHFWSRLSHTILRCTPIAALALMLGAPPALRAEESGEVPYATVHKVVSRANQVKHPKIHAVVAVKSKDKTAKPVTMVIQAKSGWINVSIAEDGEIRNFPISQELLKENPPVLSNQPKGSSQLVACIELVVPDTTTYSYRELTQLLDEANGQIRKQAGMLSIMAPRAKALSSQFRGGGNETVTIKRNEPQVLTADANGVVRLEIDKSVAAQDPQVVVSAKPAKVLVN